MRIIRAIIALLILLILVVLFIVGCLLYFVDPNKIKPIIITEVEKRSGYHLTMDSRLSWAFYPTISIVAPQITVTAPQENHPFLILNNVKIATKLSSLWEEKQKLLGDFVADNAQLGRARMQKLVAKLSWQHNSLSLSNVRADFYSGKLQADINIGHLNSDPTWQWNSIFTNVQLQPLLNDLNAGESRIQIAGNSNARFAGNTVGKNKNGVLQAMQATMQLSINNGLLYGVDLNYLLQNAQALIHKTPVTSANTDQTPFESLSGNATIAGGVLRTNNLVLISGGFKAATEGNISLLDQKLNLHISIIPKEDPAGLEIPVIVHGDVREPRVSLDMEAVSKLLAKIQLEKVKDRVQEEIDKRVPDDVGALLKNIIGR